MAPFSRALIFSSKRTNSTVKKFFTATLLFVVLITSFGCVEKQSEEIVIGAILPLTGDGAKWGETAKNAINMATNEINAEGGINGKKMKVIYEDDQGGPATGASVMTKLATVNKVPVVIGTLFSSVTLAMAPIAEGNKVVLISPASTAPKISQAGDYIFRNVAPDTFEAKEMATFAFKEMKFQHVAILYINNDYGLGLKEVFESEFKKLGGSILSEESFEQGGTDFRAQLTKIKNAKPDAVYMPGYPPEMAQIMKQAAELKLRTQFLSVTVFEDSKVLELAGQAADGVIYTTQVYDPEAKDEIVQKFVKAYKDRFNATPDIFAGLSYDATKIVALAMRQGGLQSEQIKKTLYTIKDFHGVTGLTTFDANGDVMKPIGIKVLKQGRFVWYGK